MAKYIHHPASLYLNILSFHSTLELSRHWERKLKETEQLQIVNTHQLPVKSERYLDCPSANEQQHQL